MKSKNLNETYSVKRISDLNTDQFDQIISQEALYGPPTDRLTTGKISIIIEILLVILGIIAFCSKKISKKGKIIIISSLILIGAVIFIFKGTIFAWIELLYIRD